MVGIRSFPFGFRPIFRGELLVSGRVTGRFFVMSSPDFKNASIDLFEWPGTPEKGMPNGCFQK